MPTAAELVLAGNNLTRVFQGADPQIKHDLPPSFLTVTARADRDRAEWIQVDGTRQLAQQVLYGGKSKSALPTGARQRSGTLLHTFENFALTQEELGRLRSPDETVRRLAEQSIAMKLRNQRARVDNLRLASVHAALLLGAVHFAAGQFQYSDSGATVSLDYGVPAGNKNQLNLLGGGNLLSASWATATTNIPAMLETILRTHTRKTGYQCRLAFYGDNLKTYLQTNNYTKDLIANNPAMANAFLSPGIPQGFLGLQWVPITGAYYEDAAGTLVEYSTADKLVLCPEPAPDWWQVYEGSYQVPRELKLGTSVEEMLGNLDTVYGRFAYAAGEMDPPSIVGYFGDTFAPIITNPHALLIADVTP
jgi:hypothetical protein